MAPRLTEETAHRLGPGAIGLAVLSWAAGPIMVKHLGLPGPTTAFYRLWLGFVFTAGAAGIVRAAWWRSLRQTLPAGAMFGLNSLAFFTAVHHTSIVNATLISSLSPLVVLCVAGPLFGERVGRQDVAWTGVALLGLAAVVAGSSGTQAWSLYGDILAVASLLSWSAFFVYTKHARRTLGTIEYQTGVQLGAAMIVTPFILVTGAATPGPQGTELAWVLAIVVVPGFLGHGFMSWAHRYVDVSLSSLLVLAQPALSSIIAAFVLDEPLGLVQIAGALVVIGGIGGALARHRRLEAELELDPVGEV